MLLVGSLIIASLILDRYFYCPASDCGVVLGNKLRWSQFQVIMSSMKYRGHKMFVEIECLCTRKTRRTLTLKLVNDHTKNVLCIANVENWNPNLSGVRCQVLIIIDLINTQIVR